MNEDRKKLPFRPTGYKAFNPMNRGANVPIFNPKVRARQFDNKPITPGLISWQQWHFNCDYVKRSGVKSSICVGCGKGRLYDVNGGGYNIDRRMTPEVLKQLIEKIRQVVKNDELHPDQ